jgi:hypothetical protein
MRTLSTLAQDDVSNYLKTHHYSFTLDGGFDADAQDTLRQKLKGYRLILQAEGGSHYLRFYSRLPSVWIRFLNANFGLTHFFFESGHSSDILGNRFLETGDTAYLKVRNKSFWKDLYSYNASLPRGRKVHNIGIDFERPQTYVRGLKLILPDTAPPEKIRASIDLIRNSNDTTRDCDYIVDINRQLKKALSRYTPAFKL